MTSQQLVATDILVATFALILAEHIHRTIVAMVGTLAMLLAGLIMGFYTSSQWPKASGHARQSRHGFGRAPASR